ncbi:hypothetical protein BDZ97DRAFT_2054493 [Flammula alnicola]|nr:hypothetical protein BDZ97DRAFT_2054493 [Flammula alnicola]
MMDFAKVFNTVYNRVFGIHDASPEIITPTVTPPPPPPAPLNSATQALIKCITRKLDIQVLISRKVLFSALYDIISDHGNVFAATAKVDCVDLNRAEVIRALAPEDRRNGFLVLSNDSDIGTADLNLNQAIQARLNHEPTYIDDLSAVKHIAERMLRAHEEEKSIVVTRFNKDMEQVDSWRTTSCRGEGEIVSYTAALVARGVPLEDITFRTSVPLNSEPLLGQAWYFRETCLLRWIYGTLSMQLDREKERYAKWEKREINLEEMKADAREVYASFGQALTAAVVVLGVFEKDYDGMIEQWEEPGRLLKAKRRSGGDINDGPRHAA